MVIFYVFSVIAIMGLIAYGFQIWAVRLTLKKRGTEQPRIHEPELPPLSILKPLKDIDDNLFDNLESFCVQDYPQYEIIFSLQDINDPAYKIAKKIKDKYPEKDISIIVGRNDSGLNPKVNNLMRAYELSKYELILISDSNVMVEKNYLKEIVRYMGDPKVGLVTNIILGTGGQTVGSILENLHLNTFIIGSVCFLDRFLKMPCVIGKSMLMRKKDLKEIGGLRNVKDFLAEDYIIGKKIHKKGKKVILSNHIIKNVNEYWSIKRFLNRHTRWAKIRWKIGGFNYLFELIGNSILMSSIPLLLDFSVPALFFALSVAGVKIMGDLYLKKITGSSMNPYFYLLSPIKDLIIGFLWFIPIVSNTIVWRGNRLLISRDSRLLPYPDTRLLYWKYRLIEVIKTRLATLNLL